MYYLSSRLPSVPSRILVAKPIKSGKLKYSFPIQDSSRKVSSSLLFLISSCSRIADEDGCDAVDAAGDICCCRLLEKAGDGEKLPLYCFDWGAIQ